MDNLILYDWVSITSKIHSPQDMIRLLGLEQEGITWELTKGAHGYRDRLYWERISIHFNGRDDMGVWLEMSGQGCRAFETFGTGDYESLFREVFDNPGEMNLTRLDVAFDDHSGLLDIDELLDDARSDLYVSRFQSGSAVYGLGVDEGRTATFGSRSSEILIRIYDKAAERGFTDGRHWIRVELQLRRDRALAFVLDQMTVGEKFAGVLVNYLRFVVSDPDDSNKRRWPTAPYWSQLLAGARPIHLYKKPGSEYNMLNLENFVFRQAGGAIWTYLETHSIEQFLDELKHRGVPLNAKYMQLINLYKSKNREVYFSSTSN